MKIIAHIHTDFKEKFGIPRQSGLVPDLQGTISFEPEYRTMDALKGLDGFSHLWLLWRFEHEKERKWSPTVRPPRLGGNQTMGVFATRSPFRPNPIGLSCVKIEHIENHSTKGPLIHVSGIDLLDGTEIYDIKPYLPYADCYPDAMGGFGMAQFNNQLKVVIPEELLLLLPEDKRNAAIKILEQNPVPAYQKDAKRIYGITFAEYNIQFYIENAILYVIGVQHI